MTASEVYKMVLECRKESGFDFMRLQEIEGMVHDWNDANPDAEIEMIFDEDKVFIEDDYISYERPNRKEML